MNNINPENSKNYMPKVLVLCQLFYPELVSTGQTLTELCENLVEMGIYVEVVCAPMTVLDRKTKVPRHLKHFGIQIRRVWGTRFSKLNLFGRIANQITFALSVFLYLLRDNSKRPTLVLTNPPFLASICAFLRSLKFGNPYIYVIFDVYPDTAVRLGVLSAKGLISKLWELSNKFTFKYASEIIVIGRCMQKVIRKYTNADSAKNIHNIHVWSDDKNIRALPRNENSFIKKWNIEGRFVISYSGNMGRFHDMETIMEAARILKGNEDIIFLFIGEGHKKKWTMKFAEKWQLKNCQFHTYVERKDLPYSLCCAHIGLVSLIRGQEGLSVPSKTYAFMAAGVPVVAVMSSKSEIARVLEEEECGIVFEPGDSEGLARTIFELYNNRQRLELMGRNARNAIDKNYSLKLATRSYYKLIINLNNKLVAVPRE